MLRPYSARLYRNLHYIDISFPRDTHQSIFFLRKKQGDDCIHPTSPSVPYTGMQRVTSGLCCAARPKRTAQRWRKLILRGYSQLKPEPGCNSLENFPVAFFSSGEFKFPSKSYVNTLLSLCTGLLDKAELCPFTS